jgi:hypothetical protein
VQIDVTKKLPPTSLLLIAIQQNYHLAEQIYKQKRASQDPRATFGWSAEQDEMFQRALENTRSGVVYWVGASNELSDGQD